MFEQVQFAHAFCRLLDSNLLSCGRPSPSGDMLRIPYPCMIFIEVLTSCLAPLVSPASSRAETPYYYEGQRKVSLAPLSKAADRTMAFRAGAFGALRIADENFYIVYADDWDELAIASLEREYALTPSGLRPFGAIRFYQAAAASAALLQVNRIVEETAVVGGAPLWFKQVNRRSIPQGDPLFDEQWHLHNSGQRGGVAGEDIRVEAVWPDYDGLGVVLGIVDDGLELLHPDLAANLSPLWQYDYVDNDTDPTAGQHGTAVAGVAAAVGDNGIGVRGVASGAQLVGLRLLDASGFVDELAEAEIFSNQDAVVDIFNNSWGPLDGQAGAFTGPSALARAAIEEAIANGRHGLGSIFVWAAGNGGPTDNSNLDGYANLRYTIAVTATTNSGRAASYAEPGANILLNAPSSGGSAAIATTDRTGPLGENPGGSSHDFTDQDYTSTFGGTSAATAVVSGVAALVLQANPGLNWREVQAVLALSAHQNDPLHASWQLNGAGLPISTQYGFGRVDAAAAVRVAAAWHEPVAPEEKTPWYFSNVRRAIPDNDEAGISDTVLVVENLRVEAVELTVNIPDHSYWGDIDIRLRSPAGTEVQLATSRFLNSLPQEAGYQQWTMGDVLHAGELSRGEWEIVVSDRGSGDEGTLFSWNLRIYGTAVPASASALPLRCAPRSVLTGAEQAGGIGAGVNQHGSRFGPRVTGSSYDDFMVVFGFMEVPLVQAHAVALHETAGGQKTYYARTDAGWREWSGSLADAPLPGFSPPAAEGAESSVVLFDGRLAPGSYTIYGGYTSPAGELMYCPEPVQIAVQ